MSEVLAKLEKKGGGGNADVFDELIATYPFTSVGSFSVVAYVKGGGVQFQGNSRTGDHIQYTYSSSNIKFTALTDGVYIVDGTTRQATANTVLLNASWQNQHSILWRAKDN